MPDKKIAVSEPKLGALSRVLGGDYQVEYEGLVAAREDLVVARGQLEQLDQSAAEAEAHKNALDALRREHNILLRRVKFVCDMCGKLSEVTNDVLGALRGNMDEIFAALEENESLRVAPIHEQVTDAIDLPPLPLERVFDRKLFASENRLRLQYYMLLYVSYHGLEKLMVELERQCREYKVGFSRKSWLAVYARTQGGHRGDFVYRTVKFDSRARSDLLRALAVIYSKIEGRTVMVADLKADVAKARKRARREKKRLLDLTVASHAARKAAESRGEEVAAAAQDGVGGEAPPTA